MAAAQESILGVLQTLGATLARQRDALEHSRLDELGDLNGQLERSYAALEGWPGGANALMEEIEAQPDPQRSEVRAQLGQLSADNRVSGELIRIAMHRVATIRALQAAGSDAGTYGPGNAVRTGSRLSRRA